MGFMIHIYILGDTKISLCDTTIGVSDIKIDLCDTTDGVSDTKIGFYGTTSGVGDIKTGLCDTTICVRDITLDEMIQILIYNTQIHCWFTIHKYVLVNVTLVHFRTQKNMNHI